MSVNKIITLLKTVTSERGALYVSVSGERFLLSDCKVSIEIFRHETPIGEGKIQSATVTITVRSGMVFYQPVSEGFLLSVGCFDIEADLPRRDGTFEHVVFNNAVPECIDLDGDWTFEVKADVSRLLNEFLGGQYVKR